MADDPNTTISYAPYYPGLGFTYLWTHHNNREYIETRSTLSTRPDALTFYASFTNWIEKELGRAKDARTKYIDDAQRERAEDKLVTMKQYPLDRDTFLAVLDEFEEWGYTARGNLTGGQLKPGESDVAAINQAQQSVFKVLFSREERYSNYLDKGGDPDDFDATSRKKARRARKVAEREAGGVAVGGLSLPLRIKEREERGEEDDMIE